MDFDDQLQYILLELCKKATLSVAGKKWLHQKIGFDQEIIDSLKSLSAVSNDYVARNNIFQISLNIDLAKKVLKQRDQKEKREKLIAKAIKMGASRRMLQKIANVSESDYQRIKKQHHLNIEQCRRKPRSITEKYDELDAIHDNIKKTMQRTGIQYEPLEILIRLSEVTNLELNQIYFGYWSNIYFEEGD